MMSLLLYFDLNSSMLDLGKIDSIWANWLYLGKLVLFG